MEPQPRDWAAVVDRLLENDRLAFVQLSRLISGFLARWGAFDFRDDWDDLIQEVVVVVAEALREGKIRERAAVYGFIRTTARFKFGRLLRSQLRCSPSKSLPLDEVLDAGQSEDDPTSLPTETCQDLENALQRLPEKQRMAVVCVYRDGHTYDQAAERTGIPLGTLKRCLREGLAQLREDLGDLVNEI